MAVVRGVLVIIGRGWRRCRGVVPGLVGIGMRRVVIGVVGGDCFIDHGRGGLQGNQQRNHDNEAMPEHVLFLQQPSLSVTCAPRALNLTLSVRGKPFAQRGHWNGPTPDRILAAYRAFRDNAPPRRRASL